MSNFFGIITGVITVLLLGPLVKNLVDNCSKDLDLTPPSKFNDKDWENAIGKVGKGSGELLGRLERLMFFGALWANFPEIIIAWLAFKLASKWHAYNTIMKVPDSLGDTNDFTFLKARRNWGGVIFTRFLVGTISNILTGFIGFMVGTGIKNW